MSYYAVACLQILCHYKGCNVNVYLPFPVELLCEIIQPSSFAAHCSFLYPFVELISLSPCCMNKVIGHLTWAYIMYCGIQVIFNELIDAKCTECP